MDGVSITIDGVSVALLVFILTKLFQLERRVARIEDKLDIVGDD